MCPEQEANNTGKLQFGLWDSFGVNEMARSPVAADIYEQHIGQV